MEIHIAFDVNVPHWINIFFFPHFSLSFGVLRGFVRSRHVQVTHREVDLGH